ncbi:hypothetical protein TanjilG_26855 [Lupinus angustifolius]|uniref:EF-hand domain-containing protein n=1 Tax=Lupinus angustifolius TaxID=3871 RepID=A0A4P1RIF1_LUPAN|nr:PREDICTED: probable calcium-binding protein CML35 [Lupinus angustifolius]OIW11489.1 hypothetical protein TanjilG_26855 [Lupinus angustifolius]
MKLINSLNPKKLKLSPKRLFRSKKNRSTVSRSDPPSFGSGSLSSSSEGSIHKTETGATGSQTPTSVLPDVSDEWTAISGDLHFDLSNAFRFIDRDNDGVVSRNELEALLTRLTAAPEVAMMLSEVEFDGEGCITVEALMNRVGFGSGSVESPDELMEAFAVFDTDHDGRISAEELLRVFQAIGDERCTLEECRRMIESVDRNGDGFVCFADFSRMMELQR